MSVSSNINCDLIVRNYSRASCPLFIRNTLINRDRLTCLHARSIEIDLCSGKCCMCMYLYNIKKRFALSKLFCRINSIEIGGDSDCLFYFL